MKTPYVVFARKYRPQGFEEVLGQPAASITLKNALEQKKVHHAYLFTGPRGVGKTTMARILAKALNCAEGATSKPCGKCDSCREVAASSSLDVLEMDAASHTGVDNIRQVIIETVALAPSRDRNKIFIIDEAHMLSSAAFNALLKTLEEPPPHVVFILATTESAKIPATIASRCQRFRFRPIAVETLVEHLGMLAKKESVSVEAGALELLARSAEGSLRDAVSLLDQSHSAAGGRITEAHVRDMFGFVSQDLLRGVAQSILERKPQDLARWLGLIYSEGLEPAQLLRDLRAALENIYLKKLGATSAVEKGLEDLAKAATPEALSFLLRRLNRTLEELRFTDSPRLILELGLFSCLESAFDLTAWAQRLENLEKRLATGAPASARVAEAAAPRAARTEQEMPRTAAAASSDVWRAAIEAVRKEKAALASTLEKARLVRSESGPWKLIFEKSFDLEAAKRAQTLIEASLATVAGKTVALSLELGQGATPSEIVDRKAVEASTPPSGTWKDITEGAQAEPAGGLAKAQKILGGKVKIIKKPS